MLKFCLILGSIMLLISIIANVAAFVIEKKYKSKMQNVTKNNDF